MADSPTIQSTKFPLERAARIGPKNSRPLPPLQGGWDIHLARVPGVFADSTPGYSLPTLTGWDAGAMRTGQRGAGCEIARGRRNETQIQKRSAWLGQPGGLPHSSRKVGTEWRPPVGRSQRF